MNKIFMTIALTALISTTVSATTLNTRYGKLNIKSNMGAGEVTLSLGGKTFKRMEANDTLETHGIYHLGKDDIIPLSDGSADGGVPAFQYILVIKPGRKTQWYEYPNESMQAKFSMQGKEFVATYDQNQVAYDGQKFRKRTKGMNPDLFRPVTYLPLELCKAVYDMRGDLIDTYQEKGKLDVYDFAQYAHQTIRELNEHYQWFSPKQMMALGGKHDKYLEKIGFEDFKNTICVKPH